jgi:beta-lactamase superfamily II metal-dependent hydrolase
MLTEETSDAPDVLCAVHLLDVGVKEYGDAVLCTFGSISVLIDGAHTGDQTGKGGHPSIPDQIGRLLGQQQPPYRVSLLVVSHAHEDHIGCLPHLVEQNLLRADWALVTDPKLGWGRALDDAVADVHADERVRQVVAAVREEVRTKGTDSEGLEQFLSDAANLEQRYNNMLNTLSRHGTRVVRYGRDSTTKLLNAFAEVGLNILGPSKDQLVYCAERIAQATDAAVQDAAVMFQSDRELTAADAYRQLVSGAADAADAVSRPGPAVNLQSLVISFKYKRHKLLFAGDMQFADPQVKGLDESVRKLREVVRKGAPYSFVKLSHHGSDNAFDEEILDELGGTSLFGICAGEKSTAHPHRSTLELLDRRRDGLKWVRTDHNGLTSILFKKTGNPKIIPTEGKINDAQPNDTDETAPTHAARTELAAPASHIVEGTRTPAPQESTHGPGDVVEVVARVPHTSTRVTITIDVEPRASQPVAAVEPVSKTSGREPAGGGTAPAAGSGAAQPDPRPTPQLPPLDIAGGRQLPELIFVTSGTALADNIGNAEYEHLLAAMQSKGLNLYTHLPRSPGDSTRAAAVVREIIGRHSKADGVVLLGGHDVIPSQRVDCLPSSLRKQLRVNGDADDFIVWSDDVYGDSDGDGLPELPVSRIPDGYSAQLVFAALGAGARPEGRGRASGVRNVARPFAELIFRELGDESEMLVSEPLTSDESPRGYLEGDSIYIMLHGDFTDTSRFWGENTSNNREAINLGNIPAETQAVVFTGCCWGALTVTTPAGRLRPGGAVGQRTPEDSVALRFLRGGAAAFVGCTGSHYSPLERPYKFFGGPFHEAFWRAYTAGKPPARAVFDAKLEYIRGMPHGQTATSARAIEYKIFRQYTCLGLGW